MAGTAAAGDGQSLSGSGSLPGKKKFVPEYSADRTADRGNQTSVL